MFTSTRWRNLYRKRAIVLLPESAGNLVAGLCQPRGLRLEEGFEDRVAPEQLFPAPADRRTRARLSVQAYEIHTPALPRWVHEPSVFENRR